MNLKRMKADFKYIIINKLIINIPCWFLRKNLLKCLGLQIGNNSRIAIGTTIINPRGITIGDRTTINENCHLDGRGGLYIGNDVSISVYTKIITASHRSNSDTFEYYEGSVKIEDNVWTGCNAIILDGSIIKRFSIIGAGCVFKGTTEEKDIFIGNPAKKIRKRELESAYKLMYKPYFR